jgi:putative spermidine/putrescine transport system permease protein
VGHADVTTVDAHGVALACALHSAPGLRHQAHAVVRAGPGPAEQFAEVRPFGSPAPTATYGRLVLSQGGLADRMLAPFGLSGPGFGLPATCDVEPGVTPCAADEQGDS